MQTADLDEFEELIGKLCAGYEVPVTKHRKDAHWLGCRKLTIAQYRRCVEFALSDAGPDDLPSTKIMWRIHRQLTSGSTRSEATAATHAKDPDHLEYLANRLLFLHLRSRGGLGSIATFIPGSKDSMMDAKPSPEMAEALATKRRLVDEFVGYIREGDELATPANFTRAWLAAMKRISPPTEQTVQALKAAIAAPGMDKPFPPSMARELIRASA